VKVSVSESTAQLADSTEFVMDGCVTEVRCAT